LNLLQLNNRRQKETKSINISAFLILFILGYGFWGYRFLYFARILPEGGSPCPPLVGASGGNPCPTCSQIPQIAGLTLQNY